MKIEKSSSLLKCRLMHTLSARTDSRPLSSFKFCCLAACTLSFSDLTCLASNPAFSFMFTRSKASCAAFSMFPASNLSFSAARFLLHRSKTSGVAFSLSPNLFYAAT